MEKEKQVSSSEKPIVYKVAGEEVKLSVNIVKQFIARGGKLITQEEAVNFMQLCKYRKLNPFTNEAYLIKFGNEAATFVVGADAFKRRAEENMNYDRFEAGIIVQRDKEVIELEGEFKLPNDLLLGGWAKVYLSNNDYPKISKVSMAEYGKTQSTWKSMPCTMIRKVALVHALRDAFPNDLGGMYVEDELKNTKFRDKTQDFEETKTNVEDQVKEVINEEPEVMSFTDVDYKDTPYEEGQ